MNSNTGKNEGIGQMEQRKDFLQLLLELREQDGVATSISMRQVKAMLTDILEGVTDTTSTMVEWVMAQLMQHPEAKRKVNEELIEFVGLDSLVEESHLPKLHYLDVVIKETFRLHPALPFLVPRCPSQSNTVVHKSNNFIKKVGCRRAYVKPEINGNRYYCVKILKNASLVA
ncbi:hypothetical protein SO802_034105 [Lithocarpus litseifolius]|uniref:Cytochrome P450 76AD1-like protein n=1 Tax=Lithocarpus litseifolius TaxID=425828 RepID=A0AAW2BI89_9ROSI